MASSFGAQLQAFADKTGEKLENVDRAFKLELFGRVVRGTRVADPLSWKVPDPDYKGGTMRGNWQVTIGAPAGDFLENTRNISGTLPGDEQAKIVPFSLTYLTNNTPYVLVYEEEDGMVAAALAAARQALTRAVEST